MGRIAILLLLLLPLSGWTADKAAAEATPESAERDMQVARYYVGRGDYTGSINRFKIVLTKSHSSQFTEEALAGLTEAYLALGIASEARTAAGLLVRKFPDGDWTAKARAKLTAAGLVPAENPASWISRAVP
jgi:outer membrane protein assembly factor BamD